MTVEVVKPMKSRGVLPTSRQLWLVLYEAL